MNFPLPILLMALSSPAFAAEETGPECRLAASPTSCQQNNGTNHDGARRAKDAFDAYCPEGKQMLQDYNRQKQQQASKCAAVGTKTSQNVGKNAQAQGEEAHRDVKNLTNQDSSLAKTCSENMNKISKALGDLAKKMGQKAEALERAKAQGGGAVQQGCEGARRSNDGLIDQARDGFQQIQKSAQASSQDAKGKGDTYDRLAKALDGTGDKNIGKAGQYTSDKSQDAAIRQASGSDAGAGKKGGDPGGQAGGQGSGGGEQGGGAGQGQGDQQAGAQKGKEGGGSGGGSGGGQQGGQGEQQGGQEAAERAAKEKKLKEELARKEKEEAAKIAAEKARQDAIDKNRQGEATNGQGANVQK